MLDTPLILISNDDGIHAEGLRALKNAVAELGDVYVVAPEHEQSAQSHAITLRRPLRLRSFEKNTFSVDGTPADCVYAALYLDRFLPKKPDLVLSGINHGPNLGSDIFYSGTVAAAREAALRGVPAMAFSMVRDSHPNQQSIIARDLAKRMLTLKWPEGPAPLINVNFPMQTPKGIRTTRLGKRLIEGPIVARQDPGGRDYFWIGADLAPLALTEGTDTEAFAHGYISVTPLPLEAAYEPHLDVARSFESVSI